MNDKFYNNLKDDLKPYYSKGDCCSWIVELRKENNQLQSNWNNLREYIKNNSIYYNTSDGCQRVDQFKLLDKMTELEGKDKE